MSSGPGLLLALAGLETCGGIASVARCVTRVCDEAVRAGSMASADRVLLFDDPADPPAPPPVGEQLLAGSSMPRFVSLLWTQARRRRPDIVFVDQAGVARALLVPGLRGLRYAIFCHGGELERARSGIRRSAVQRAWRLLANSEHTVDRLGRLFPECSDRIRLVPLCIDPQRVAAWREPAADAIGAPRPPIALIVGRMWSEERGKGHDALIEAWPAVRQAVPGAELHIAGEGDDEPRLRAKARERGLDDAVRFLGRVSDAELSHCYRGAAVLAMPSRQEGFGLVYAEAMWHGTPCIGSTADAARVVIRHDETGLLVPYGDVSALTAALCKVLGDVSCQGRLAKNARQQALAEFGYERFRRDLMAALELRP